MSGSQLWAAVVLLLLLQSAQGVYIKYHGFQVQLESVKKLSELEEKQMSSPQLRKSGFLLPDVCHNPALPLDLQPICASQEAANTFKALSKDIHPQIFLPLSLDPPLRLHCQLFLLSNPMTVDRGLGGSYLCPPDLPQSGHIESGRKELHSPEKFLKDHTSWRGGTLGRDRRDSTRHI